MTAAQPHPEVVQVALAWLRTHGTGVDDERLERALLDAGYEPQDVAAAMIAYHGGTPPEDLRGRAATILVVGFVLAWLAVATILSAVNPPYGLAGAGAMVLGIVLLVVLGFALLAVGASGKLRSGSRDALAVAIAIPFVLLFVLAGSCVAMLTPRAG